jgi:integrase
MANSKVTLMRYCRVDLGERAMWKRYPAAFGRNGRIRPEYVVIGGQQVHCPIGHYELRFYEGSKLRYENVGKNATTAVTKKLAKDKALAARTAADAAGIRLVEQEGRKNLRKEVDRYVTDRENANRTEAARQARRYLDDFTAITKKTFVDELTPDDIYAFHAHLRKNGASDRTVANKHARVRSFLIFAGANLKAVMPEKPTYEKKLPTVYTPQEIGALLAAADGYMRVVISLGLKCGLRESEIAHLEWSDINWTDKVLRVQGKPQWDFKVKDSEQRDIPIPDDLLADLAAWREERGKTKLVVGTDGDLPNTHLLRQMKRLATRAALNCNMCEGCKSERKECAEWTLHKLRRTYATTLLRNGVDVRTVMKFCGWSDLETAMKYLRPAGSKETQAAISAIQFAELERKTA